MEQKEFCLKWNKYLDVFRGAFSSLLNSENFTDVTLSCDSRSIKCHRLVLSSCSFYFETLLLGISHPHPVIILKDVKFDDLLSLVKFMYTGEVTIPQAQTCSLIKVAEMLKVKGLAYPDVSVNQTQKPSYLSQNTQMTQPAAKRNRIDTTSENSLLAEDSSSNLGPPVADASNNKLVIYPTETSSCIYKTDIAVYNSLQVKDEFAVGIDKGRNNSSSQFEDDGEQFDYGSEKLIENPVLERTNRMPNGSLKFSEVGETFPDFSEDILSPKHEDVSLVASPIVSEQLNCNFKPPEFQSSIPENGKDEDALLSHNEEFFGVPNFLLFPKLEDVPLGSFPGFSGPSKLQSDTQESGATSFDCQGVADTSSSNTNALMEASNFNIELQRKKYRKDYECNLCDKRFTFHSSLERHQRMHTGKKPYTCDVCKKAFSRADYLNTHKGRHTGAADASSNNANLLKNASHPNIGLLRKRSKKDNECNICDKRFPSHSKLERHQRIHTGKKPFKCAECHKSFSQFCNLNKHQRVHTGEKPFKCDLCQKSFSQLVNLNRHRILHKGVKPF